MLKFSVYTSWAIPLSRILKAPELKQIRRKTYLPACREKLYSSDCAWRNPLTKGQVILMILRWYPYFKSSLFFWKEQTFDERFLVLELFHTTNSAWIRRLVFICYGTYSILPKLNPMGILLAFTLILLFFFPAPKTSFYSTLIRIGLSGIRKGNRKLHGLCLGWKTSQKISVQWEDLKLSSCILFLQGFSCLSQFPSKGTCFPCLGRRLV